MCVLYTCEVHMRYAAGMRACVWGVCPCVGYVWMYMRMWLVMLGNNSLKTFLENNIKKDNNKQISDTTKIGQKIQIGTLHRAHLTTNWQEKRCLMSLIHTHHDLSQPIVTNVGTRLGRTGTWLPLEDVRGKLLWEGDGSNRGKYAPVLWLTSLIPRYF